MDDAHKKANETRRANEEARFLAQKKAAEELAESVRGLNSILNDPGASLEQRIEVAKMIVELVKRR